MNYLQATCLTQALYLKELFSKRNLPTILKKLYPLYLCDLSMRKELDEIASNDTFSCLTSERAIQIHQNYLSICPDENEFGKKNIEADALELKKAAYFKMSFSSKNRESSFYEYLTKHYLEDNTLCITFALIILLKGGTADMYLPLLQKAEANGTAEASLILTTLDHNRKEFHINQLERSKFAVLYPDTITHMKLYHSGQKGENTWNN